VAAIKSLVASLALGALLAPSALADSPVLRIDANDQAWAAQALLRASDFSHGWQGGPVKSQKPAGPDCPGFEPKASDLVVSGHATASFKNQRAGVQIVLDTQVMETVAYLQKDFARTIQPGLPGCLAHQLKQGEGINAVTVTPLAFPKVGAVSAAYRAVVTLRSRGRTAKVISDYVFFGNGRLEYSLNVIAPLRYKQQLVSFEVEMARMLVKRGARTE
jgi:hypothetical protein